MSQQTLLYLDEFISVISSQYMANFFVNYFMVLNNKDIYLYKSFLIISRKVHATRLCFKFQSPYLNKFGLPVLSQ